MSNKILVNAVDPEQCRIAMVRDGKLEQFHTESASRAITQRNIYKGVIAHVEPSLQAVFVDYGAERHGFLQQSEIHYTYLQETGSRSRSLEDIVQRGDELVVQVTKDPIMNKGAMLTTFISLPGRFLVLRIGSDSRGISRQIEDEDERARLKEMMQELSVPEDHGIIVRTAGADCTKTLLTKDLKHLLRRWKSIRGRVMKEPAPALLYKEEHLAVSSLRDHLTPDISEIRSRIRRQIHH